MRANVSRFVWTALALCAAAPVFSQTAKEDKPYVLPVTPPVSLSANFAEVRPNHFHAGVDIRMAGRKSDIYATADGYISRIGVSPYGYGNVLYITHPGLGSTMTVYGHMREFRKDIQDYVKEQQYARRSFAVSLFPAKERFPVKQGDLIGYAGNSGSSSGVHLHYELRDRDQDPLNLLRRELVTAKDDIPPTLMNLIVVEVDTVRGVPVHRKVRTCKLLPVSEGRYRVSPDTLTVTRPAYFALEYNDRKNDTPSKFGIYQLELRREDMPLFRMNLDEVSYTDMNHINSLIMYREHVQSPYNVVRAYIAPNNRLRVYDRALGNGILLPEAAGTVREMEFRATDDSDNVSSLTFWVRSAPAAEPKKEEAGVPVFWRSGCGINEKDYAVTIPPLGLFESILLQVRTEPDERARYSAKVVAGDPFVPLAKPATVTIRPDRLPDSLRSKAFIMGLNHRNKPYYVGGKWQGDRLTATTKSLGGFYVDVDNTPPTIRPVSKNGTNIAQRGKVSFTVSDNKTGVSSWTGLIDGKWALFEFDAKNAHLYHRFDPQRFEKGKMHTVELEVRDAKDNRRRVKMEYFW